MKSVLISIQPKWVEKIASGEKTIEVRKSRPKLETPFKCYIYCTKAKEVVDIGKTFSWGKEVIGEFVCDNIIKASKGEYGRKINGRYTQIDVVELLNYATDKNGELITLYGWHITDLKIYDKPKELSEFRKPFVFDDRPMKDWCHNHCEICDEKNCKYDLRITRPPQSWQFVESLGE